MNLLGLGMACKTIDMNEEGRWWNRSHICTLVEPQAGTFHVIIPYWVHWWDRGCTAISKSACSPCTASLSYRYGFIPIIGIGTAKYLCDGNQSLLIILLSLLTTRLTRFIIRFLKGMLTRQYLRSRGFICLLNTAKSPALTASWNATKLSFFNVVRIA